MPYKTNTEILTIILPNNVRVEKMKKAEKKASYIFHRLPCKIGVVLFVASHFCIFFLQLRNRFKYVQQRLSHTFFTLKSLNVVLHIT